MRWRRGALALTASVLLLGTGPSRGDEAARTRLRRALEAATTPQAQDETLDRLAEEIGEPGGFPTAADYADWLGELPVHTAGQVRVRLRRAWGYLVAGRAREASPLLESVITQDGEELPVALAYLGEAERQVGRLDRAFELLTAASRAGYVQTFVIESVQKTAFQLRSARPPREASGLPDYVTALEGYLGVLDNPLLHGTLARWLLDDYGAWAVPGRPRARAWARAAAPHALAAARTAAASGADARLLWDAARALEPEDEETGGRTARYELLAWAWRLGNRPQEDTHELPQVIAALAEAALRDGRYELALRLARQRLAISDSPAARRVLRALPPDVGTGD